MANAYPELPVLPYQRTTVLMQDVINYLRGHVGIPLEVKRMTYIVCRNESSNGRSGVNNNLAGFQADGGRWSKSLDHFFVGTTTVNENQTGHSRIFLCFASWQDSLNCLSICMQARGLYVGGKTWQHSNLDVVDPTTLARAYTKEWVRGSSQAEPSDEALQNFLSMYAQAAGPTIFPDNLRETPTVEPVKPPVTASVQPTEPPIQWWGEVGRLRAALTDIIARANAALAAMPAMPDTPPVVIPPFGHLPPAVDPDNSADILNEAVLNREHPP